jgi:hypothetical protein
MSANHSPAYITLCHAWAHLASDAILSGNKHKHDDALRILVAAAKAVRYA